jgi:hypothetical protein
VIWIFFQNLAKVGQIFHEKFLYRFESYFSGGNLAKFHPKKKTLGPTELKLGVQIGERPLRATPPGRIKLSTQSRAGARFCYAFLPAFKGNYVKLLRPNHCAEPNRPVLTFILLISNLQGPILRTSGSCLGVNLSHCCLWLLKVVSSLS